MPPESGEMQTFSDYWRCRGCRLVIYSPTTGLPPPAPCNHPRPMTGDIRSTDGSLVIRLGERDGTWEPVTPTVVEGVPVFSTEGPSNAA